MPSPFPGMDPYLESPSLWPDVHAELIVQIRAAINARVRPKYVARVEKRVYISDDEDPGRELMVPDIQLEVARPRTTPAAVATSIDPSIRHPMLMEEEIREGYVSIYDAVSSKLVTVLEVLSPSNKLKGSKGRKSFLKKRKEVLGSLVHWVEIDLLRAGERIQPKIDGRPSDYRVSVSRGDQRGDEEWWLFGVRDRLPTIGIPLRGKDPDAALPLQEALRIAYDNADYDASIDYSRPPDPPLNAADAKWANALLKSKGLR